MQQQTAAQLLSEQRQMIDAIDQQLVTLFEQRMAVVRQVADIKYDAGLPVFDAKREQAVLACVTQQVTEAFAAQATSGAVEPPFLSHHLLLVDSKGTGLILFPGPDHTLVDPLNKRVWQVPDHLRLPLEGRGLIFP